MESEKNNVTINLIHGKTLNSEEVKELNVFCGENSFTLLEFSKHRSIIKGNKNTINKIFFNVNNKNEHVVPKEIQFVNNVIGLNNKKICKPYVRLAKKNKYYK